MTAAAALQAGWSIIPTDRDKRPIIPAWKPYQTRYPNAAEFSAWSRLKPATWAVVTGALSGRLTLDFDGNPGRETLERLGLKPHRQTPSGGFHVDFKHPGWYVPTLNAKSKRELGERWPGLDIRADGGYAVFTGQTDRGEYIWLRGPDAYELDLLPVDVREFLGLVKPKATPDQQAKGRPQTSPSNGRVASERLIRAALDRVGSLGRNNAGFWLAGQLRDNGYDQSEAEAAMRNYRGRVPASNTKGAREAYTEAEMLASLREAYNRPAREPWGPGKTNGGKSPNPESANTTNGDGDCRDPKSNSRLIVNDNGTPKALLANAIIALRTAPAFEGVLAFDQFTLEVVALKPPPWPSPSAGTWTDHEERLVTVWLQHRGIYVSVAVAGEAVQVVARDHLRHPVREYLESLKWDGTKRIDSWLSLYLGVRCSDYAAAVGARWLISAVARIYEPGTKADCCLILEGVQGLGKSRSLRILGGNWFTDEIADLGSKDAAMQARGVWIIELGELDAMSRSETASVKAFMSRSTDRFRPPYGRHLLESPRQCVFCGSVNKKEYLKDETGGRRFWPVACTCARIVELEQDRDQLWAEALVAYRGKRAWWIDSPEVNRLAEEQQRERYETDPWDVLITEFISKRDDVSVAEVLEQCIGKKREMWAPVDQMRVGKSLVSLGWVRFRTGPRDKPRSLWAFDSARALGAPRPIRAEGFQKGYPAEGASAS